MSRTARYTKFATVKRQVTGSDGFGGKSKNETTITSGYKFHVWNITPTDRELFVSKYGLEQDVSVRIGTGEYNNLIQNGDILDVSASERYEILAANEVWGKSTSTPVAYGLVLATAGSRP